MSISVISEQEMLGGIKRRIRFSITGAHKASLAGEALVGLGKERGINATGQALYDQLVKKFDKETVDGRMLGYVAMRCALPYVREQDLPVLYNPEPVKKSEEGMLEKTDLEFDVDVFVRPNLELSSYEPVYIEKTTARVTDEQINAQLMREMNRFVTYEDSDEPVCEGDCVQVNLSTLVNGAPDMSLSGDGLVIVLSKDVMPAPFVNEVVGMNTDEHKEFEFDNLESDGNIVKYRCAIDVLDKKHRNVPELTDEFVASQLSATAKTVNEFKEIVRDFLEKEGNQGDSADIEARIDEELSKRLLVSIPDELIERTARDMMDSIRQNAEASGMSLADFAKMQAGGEQQFQVNVMRQARESLRQGLALDALFAHYNMTITDADEEEALHELAPGNEQVARRSIADNDAWYLVRNMAMRLKAHNWLVKTAVFK